MQKLKNILACLLGLLVYSIAQAQPNLTKVEYYIDNDPGYGKADTVIGISGKNVSNKILNINVSALNEGLHFLGIRALDSKGAWSHDNKLIFLKPFAADIVTPNLTRVEYYIDTDPGYGKADTVMGISGKDIRNGFIGINTDTLKSGIHYIAIRARDTKGGWSLDNKWLFLKPETTNISAPDISQIEFYFDKDPGYGRGTPVAINEAKNYPDFNLYINISTLPAGKHKIFLRSKDTEGRWSYDYIDSLTIGTAITDKSIVVTSISSKILCAGSQISVSYQKQGTFSPTNRFKVQLGDSSGNFDTTEIGSVKDTASRIITCQLPAHLSNGSMYKIRVISTNPALISVNTLDSITVHNNPYAQTIIGPSDANAGTSYLYSVPAVTGSTWKWIAESAAVLPNDNTANVTWSIAGTQYIKVVEKDSYGCYGDTSSKKVNVYKPRIDSVTISDLTPCPGQSREVTAKVSGVFGSGNVFKAQLSSSGGGFNSYKNIGSITLSDTGSNQLITIPVTLGSVVNGSKYRVRIVSTSPAVTSADNGRNIVINKPNLGADTGVFVCPGNTANLTSLYNTNGYASVVWSTPNPQSALAGSYTLMVKNNGGCSDTAAITVNERMNPTPVINPAGNVKICPADSISLSVANNYPAYMWNNGENTRAISVKTAGSYQVTVTDPYGCHGTSASTVVSLDTCGRPGSLIVSSVTGTSAAFSWNTVSCAMGYELRYKAYGAANWTNVPVNSASVTVTGLSVSTKYKWQVLTVCKDNSRSSYSSGSDFNTQAQSLAESRDAPKESMASGLRAYVTPNPAGSFTTLHIVEAKGAVQISLIDMQGQMLWRSKTIQANNIRIPLELMAKGVYLLTVADKKESLIISVIKE